MLKFKIRYSSKLFERGLTVGDVVHSYVTNSVENKLLDLSA